MTAKFLANYNLNLLLTKYYKKRLESQLKNREIYIHAYITFTKLTDDFWLSPLADCNMFFDSSSISYILFIPLFSLVPTLLSIPNSPSISYIFLISTFSLISQLSSNVKTLSCTKNNINPAKKMIESNINNTKKRNQHFQILML